MEYFNQAATITNLNKDIKNKLWGTNSRARISKEIDFEQLVHLISIGWRRNFIKQEFKITNNRYVELSQIIMNSEAKGCIYDKKALKQ
jgi:hypothetical protein